MSKLNEIVSFLDEYLQKDDIKDGSWNGLQFEGKAEVSKVAFAVDAGIDTYNEAIKEKADMIVVHHGHFWKEADPSISGWNKKRMDLLYQHGISLYASHLPLDRHREVGNNAQLLQMLGVTIKEEFYFFEGKNVGWIGERENPISLPQVQEILSSELRANCTVLPFGKQEIKTIAVCSGGGGYGGFFEALGKKVDLYISGDAVEVYLVAKDAGFNVIFAGHHATETVGVKALSKVVEEKFGVKTVFIDIPTGL